MATWQAVPRWIGGGNLFILPRDMSFMSCHPHTHTEMYKKAATNIKYEAQNIKKFLHTHTHLHGQIKCRRVLWPHTTHQHPPPNHPPPLCSPFSRRTCSLINSQLLAHSHLHSDSSLIPGKLWKTLRSRLPRFPRHTHHSSAICGSRLAAAGSFRHCLLAFWPLHSAKDFILFKYIES